MSKKIKILTPRKYEHSDFFHNAVDFAREHSLNTNEFCLELSHYLVDNFDKVWKIEKPIVYKQIADLEAKLAEKEKEIQNWETMYRSVMQSCHNGIEEDKRLREQLAEKETELEDWKDGTIAEKLWHLERQLVEKEEEIEKYKQLCTISKLEDLQIENMLLKGKNQDKISFCIGQLEKVKELGNKNKVWRDGEVVDYMITIFESEINNQIDALRNNKYGKH